MGKTIIGLQKVSRKLSQIKITSQHPYPKKTGNVLNMRPKLVYSMLKWRNISF